MRKETVLAGLGAILLAVSGCREVVTPESESGGAQVPPTDTPSSGRATPTPPIQPSPATSTPTITPTPIIHVVQGGETLSGIAAQYGVSVQALRAANGITDPQLLQPGQELVIPTGEETTSEETDLLLPTPTPIPFGVRGIGFFETPSGSLDCMGEIVNTTSFTLANLQVRVTLFDESGIPVIEQDAFATADVLPPGQRAPFRILFRDPPAGFARYDANPIRGEIAGSIGRRYVPLAVSEDTLVPSGPQLEVSGRVQNLDPGRVASSVVIIVTAYSEDGTVTGVIQRSPDVGEGMAPGASLPFSYRFTTYGGTPARYSVTAFGRAPAEEEAPPGE